MVQDMTAILDNMVKGASADSGYKQHPCGSFDGKVEEIKQKEIGGRPIWNVSVRTTEGLAQYTIWGFNQSDIAQAEVNQDKREKILKSITRTKAIYVDLGLPEPQAWSTGDQSVLGMMGQLKGRACTVVVQPNKYQPGKFVTFINAPNPGAPDVTTQTAQAAATQPQDTLQQPPVTAPAVGNVPNLDEIPF